MNNKTKINWALVWRFLAGARGFFAVSLLSAAITALCQMPDSPEEMVSATTSTPASTAFLNGGRNTSRSLR